MLPLQWTDQEIALVARPNEIARRGHAVTITEREGFIESANDRDEDEGAVLKSPWMTLIKVRAGIAQGKWILQAKNSNKQETVGHGGAVTVMLHSRSPTELIADAESHDEPGSGQLER
jgi:hypothetical protein